MKENMNNGFVLLETVVVLVITVVAMLGLYKTYDYVFNNLKNERYYDNMNDVYKANIVYIHLLKKGLPNVLDKGYVIIDSDNCNNYMDNNCNEILEALGVDYAIYTDGEIENILINHENDLKNTDIEYLRRLEFNKNVIISYKNEKDNYYYASIDINDLVHDGI